MSADTPTTGRQPEDALGGIPRRASPLGLLVRLAPLVLLVPPLFAFFLTNPPAERSASLVAAVATFVAIVLWAVAAPRDGLPARAAVATLALTVLAAAVTLIVPRSHWLVLFLYPVVIAAFLPSMRQATIAILAVAIVMTVAGWAILTDAANRIERPLEFAFIGFGALALARLVIVNRQLEQARAEIARLAAADERLRISRDLHDLLGQGLSVIALKAQLAGRLLPSDAARAGVELADIEAVSRRSLEDVRAAVGGYRRLRLDTELLGARATLEAADIATEIDHQAGSLPDPIDEACAWSVREGATNIVRHGQGRKAVIRTRLEDAAVVLEIVNDGGSSTSPVGVQTGPATPTGSGLAGLAERVGAIGGRVEAAPRREGGFRLAVVIPLEADPT